jgi:hypothetical protein
MALSEATMKEKENKPGQRQLTKGLFHIHVEASEPNERVKPLRVPSLPPVLLPNILQGT